MKEFLYVGLMVYSTLLELTNLNEDEGFSAEIQELCASRRYRGPHHLHRQSSSSKYNPFKEFGVPKEPVEWMQNRALPGLCGGGTERSFHIFGSHLGFIDHGKKSLYWKKIGSEKRCHILYHIPGKVHHVGLVSGTKASQHSDEDVIDVGGWHDLNKDPPLSGNLRGCPSRQTLQKAL